MTDCLERNFDAIHVSASNFDQLKECAPETIITNAFHCVSPRFVFDRHYWQKILDFGCRLLPVTFGFRYHENGDFFLTDDMIYIFKQIAERNEIGVRGERTAEILDDYGIGNIRIVGCHSLFYHMDECFSVGNPAVPVENVNFNFNTCYQDFFMSHEQFCKTLLPIFNYFLELGRTERINIDYTMQTDILKELIGYGNFASFKSVSEFVMKKGRYFFSVDDWIAALRKNKFSIGTQFHGNIASILAGTPSLLIVIDRRMEELARYHKIPFITPEQFNPKRPIDYYAELCDYSAFNRQFRDAYRVFREYLRKNNVSMNENPALGAGQSVDSPDSLRWR